MLSFQQDLENDLKDILKGDFTETRPVTITVGTKVFPDIEGIFDETFFLEGDDLPQQTANSQIGIFVKTIDDALGFELSEDDFATVLIGTQEYRIGQVERDGTGYGLIELKKDKNP